MAKTRVGGVNKVKVKRPQQWKSAQTKAKYQHYCASHLWTPLPICQVATSSSISDCDVISLRQSHFLYFFCLFLSYQTLFFKLSKTNTDSCENPSTTNIAYHVPATGSHRAKTSESQSHCEDSLWQRLQLGRSLQSRYAAETPARPSQRADATSEPAAVLFPAAGQGVQVGKPQSRVKPW